jgi:hypothetical protein
LLYMAAVLCMSISCKKELVPEDPLAGFRCNDGTCCGRDNTTYEYVQTIKDLPADFFDLGGGKGFIFKEMIGAASVCDLSLVKVKEFKHNYDPVTWPLKYNVSGKIYADVSNPRLTKDPIYYILIDSVKANN